jgi:hypothetical protein
MSTPRPPTPDDLADIDRVVEYWQGSPQVRRRIEAINDVSASLVVFLEYFPQNLNEWFSTHLTDSAWAMVERVLAAGTSFMNACGLLHFDAHFENVLTDGERLYFADFGLAMDLSRRLAGRGVSSIHPRQERDDLESRETPYPGRIQM